MEKNAEVPKKNNWISKYFLNNNLGIYGLVSVALVILFIVSTSNFAIELLNENLGKYAELSLIIYGLLIYFMIVFFALFVSSLLDLVMRVFLRKLISRKQREIASIYDWIGNDGISHGLLNDIFDQKLEKTEASNNKTNKSELNTIFAIDEVLQIALENDLKKTKLFRNYLYFRLKNNVMYKVVAVIASTLMSALSVTFVTGYLTPRLNGLTKDIWGFLEKIHLLEIFMYAGYLIFFILIVSTMIFHYTKPNRTVKYIISVLDLQIEEMEKENEIRQI